MGQQQLILLVLATVIVGLAVVVGINAATENKAKANADALVQDGVRIASDAQMWKEKPKPFGGQDPANDCTADPCAESDFTGATLTQLGYPATSGVYENTNGEFAIETADGSNLVIVGWNVDEDNQVCITVTGTDDEDISSDVTMAAGVTGQPTCGAA